MKDTERIYVRNSIFRLGLARDFHTYLSKASYAPGSLSIHKFPPFPTRSRQRDISKTGWVNGWVRFLYELPIKTSLLLYGALYTVYNQKTPGGSFFSQAFPSADFLRSPFYKPFPFLVAKFAGNWKHLKITGAANRLVVFMTISIDSCSRKWCCCST